MKKKVLALVLVLVMAVAVLSVPAAAASDTAVDNSVDYRVGYSKVDINPYWSVWEATGGTIPTDLENYSVDQNNNPIGSDHIMPLPMGGYGGNVHRLSRPELIDDNGSGVHADNVVYLTNNRYTQEFAKEMLGDGTDAYKAYAAEGFGQNDGDGIYATCVAVQQNANAEPILIFSVDLISVAEVYAGQAKNVIIRELKEMGISISPERILINATHTHGSVALGESFTSGTTYNQKLWGNTATVPFPGSDLNNYLKTYRRHLYAQLASAAVKALTDGKANGEVVMEKGTVDVSDLTGYQLNGVRHNKAQLTTTVDGTSQTVDYVTGSSFNVNLSGGKEISSVSNSNDLLHVLQFSFPKNSKIEPVLLINWRAHTTANNKMNTKAHNNLSADFIAPMRYQLEQWGYRPILNYSTSGNLGMGDTPSTYNISTSATTTTMNATKYGYTLALAAAYLADGTTNSAVKTAYDEHKASIVSKVTTAAANRATAEANAAAQEQEAAEWQAKADKSSGINKWIYQNSATECAQKATEYRETAATYLATEQKWQPVVDKMETVTPTMVTCAQGEILLESTYYNVAYQSSSDAEYQAALYHNALAVDEGGSAANDGGLKLEKTGYPFVVQPGTYTANGSSYTITEAVVIASQYHANSLKNRHGTLNAKRISLCAFTLGNQVAFVTMPFEASDRYSMSATLETANAYNDWDSLINESAWGTPFIMSLTNGAEGYVPNNLAYTYSLDLEAKTIAGTIGQAFVGGSYEAHTAYSKAGEGEKIVAELNTLLRNLGKTAPQPTKTGYCEACKETVTWKALNDKVVEDNGISLASGHYYLAEDYTTIFGKARVYLNETVCLDLNGHTYYSNTNVGESQVFLLYGTLNIMDSVGTGVMKGKMAGSSNGGTLEVGSYGVLNLYSGTLTCDTSGDGKVVSGGVVYVGDYGTFNMYGGTVSGGKVSDYGGNVSAQHSTNATVGGTFNMYGGTISGGTAGGASYANLMISNKSTFRYNGGTITTGAFMQGTMYLGSYEPQPVGTVTSVISVRNNGTVTLDGVFTGKVKLDYSVSSVYPAAPTTGSLLGAVTSGSWIDHVGGAKISAYGTSGNASGEGYISGNQVLLGTKPTAGRCSVCNASVNWVAMDGQMFYGHYVMNQAVADMAEKTIPAGSHVCLDLNGKTYTASGRAFTVNGSLNILDGKSGGVLQGTVVDGANGGTIYVNKTGTVSQYGGKVTCQQVENATIVRGGVVFLDHGTYNLNGGNINLGKATTGGNVYLAGGNLNLAAGASIMNGTATDGGNLCIAPKASFTMTAGSLVGGNAEHGGNVCIPAEAEFVLNGGSVSSGTVTANGGNVFVAVGGTFTMNSGSLYDGWADKEGVQTTGGNVYTGGTFHLNGGNIYGGYAYYGGNVQVQNKDAYFTMTGGNITDGSAGFSEKVANLCTSSNSHFRMEGGYIAGVAYVQGDVTLTGTTSGTTPVRVSVKNIQDHLTIEGTYTGNVELVPNGGTYAIGSKIANLLDADISGAQIVVIGYENLSLAVVGNELQLSIPTDAVAMIGETYYGSFTNAFAAYTDASKPVVLIKSGVDLGTLTKDVTLDLNGYSVAAVITDGHVLTVLDTTTADYDSPDENSYGKVPAVSGVQAAEGYMSLTENGLTSFHKYEMELQYVNISPSKKGISYTTTFKGDQAIKAQVKEFGIAMRLYNEPNATTIWADPDCLTHVALKQADWQTGNHDETVKSVYIKDIVDWSISDQENAARAAIKIYGRSYIQLKNGTMIFSASAGFSMQSAMEEADELWESLGATAQQALVNMYLNPENHGFMQNWNLPNIKMFSGENDLSVTM